MTRPILIADTSEIARDTIKKVLTNRFPLIVIESPGDVCASIDAKHPPSLLLISVEDCIDDTGENIFSTIRRQHPLLTVIAIGERNQETEAVDAVKNGASGYMIKPLNPMELLSLADKNSPR